MGLNQSARLADKTNYCSCLAIFSCKHCKCNVLLNHNHANLASNVMIGPTIASCVKLNPNILRGYIA